MLDPKSIEKLNQHETSRKAAAMLKGIRPDWNLSDPQTTDDLSVVALLLALWEDEGEQMSRPEDMEREWLQNRLAEMSESEITQLLDATDVMSVEEGETPWLQDVTGSMMEALREIETEKPEDEQIVIPDFWP